MIEQDEVLRMAREAGFEIYTDGEICWDGVIATEEIERFAALVAAHALKQANLKTLFDAVYSQQTDVIVAVLAEREACANVCENVVSNQGYVQAEYAAAAIRGRGMDLLTQHSQNIGEYDER